MLRMVLDSHPLIYSSMELPWIGGNYRSDGYGADVSLKCLYRRIVNSTADWKTLEPARVRAAFRNLLFTMMQSECLGKGKQIWAEKTPDNIVQISFLAELFPEAKFIRIVRDGRDVALSTIMVNWTALNYFIEESRKNLRLINVRIAINRRLFEHLSKPLQELFLKVRIGPATDSEKAAIFYPIANTFYNALYRWKEWNRIYESDAYRLGINQLTVKYEDLLLKPTESFGRIFDFLGVDWDERILQYGNYPHQTRRADVGAGSTMKFSTIEARNAYKWKDRLTTRQRRLVRRNFDDYLDDAGYARTPLVNDTVEELSQAERKL